MRDVRDLVGEVVKPGPKPQPINHGTPGGYQTHRNRGEDACPSCRQAIADYNRRLKAAVPMTVERSRRQVAARRRALGRLAAEYPERLRDLMREEMSR